jgi:hypothetical protein
MKNKNSLLSIISTVAFLTVSLTAYDDAPPSGSFAPVVEITNKSNESIQVNIADAGTNVRKDIATAYVSPNQRWNSGDRVIDMNNKLLIEVSTKANTYAPKVFFINAPGKTKYLSWDPSKSMPLYPQTGPLAGFGKMLGMKTASGLSLDNNVSASQIQKK